MKFIVAGIVALLTIYSATLINIELNTSQDHVRHYFADIEGDAPFFAVNTTMSASFLAGACLLLLFAAANLSKGAPVRVRFFLVVQAGIFLLLALDDRFQVHEAIAYRAGVGDHYVMGAWASLQVAALALLCRPQFVNLTSAVLFAGATLFFAIMMVFDVWVAHDAVLRLSIEDLAKKMGNRPIPRSLVEPRTVPSVSPGGGLDARRRNQTSARAFSKPAPLSYRCEQRRL